MVTFLRRKLNSLPPPRHILLFISLMLLFLALGLDTKRYESLQFAGICSVYCLLREKPSLKNLKSPALFLPLLFITYVIFRPFNILIDVHLGIKMFLAFGCGIALITFFPKHYHIPILVFPVTLATIFINSYLNDFTGQWLANRYCMHFFPDPNILGYTLGVAILFCISSKYFSSRYFSAFCIFIAILCAIPLVMSASRSAIGGICAVTLFLLLLPGRRKYFFGILILIIVISVSLLFLPKPLFERLKISFLKSDDSFTNRIMAWEIATDSIKENMFFGKSNYGAFFKNYVKENSIELSKKYPGIAHSILYDTHNLLLGLVFKYGLIGFFIILFCSGYYIYVFRKSDYSILFLSIFVYTFISGIGSYYFDHTIGITSIFIPMGMNITLKRECSAISKDIDTIKLIM
ncbi:MAG: O-antigen ligase family protein [Candidatus Riflebacteria bacterium]